ncbi:MAG TPA: hypothetical protein VI008_05950 [Rubrobacter sp.]
MSANSANSAVSPPQIMSAGLAATAASFVTSRFGVAGTLLGAALTAMIITGGSAIFRSYLEAASGRVRGMPTKLRARRGKQEDGGFGGTMPGRPDLRDNFVGRMRAALDWFRHLPTLNRRSILIKGLLAAAVAFVICMGVVWGAEKVIGNSLSCGIWAKCPYGAVPGIHPAGYGGTGAGSSISGGGMNTGGVERPSLVDRVRQDRNPFGDGQPVFGNPGNGGNPGGAASSASPDPGAVPGAGGQESVPPGAGQESASPAAGQKAAPSSASPAAGQKAAPSSASPAADQ